MDLSRPGGWYPDPGDPRMLRYWDGHAWTSQVGRPPAAGWYRDPADEHSLRYWGGTAWTASTAAPPAAVAAPAVATAPMPTGTTTIAEPPLPTATATMTAPPLPTAMTTVAAPPMPAVTPTAAAPPPPAPPPTETPSPLVEAPPPPEPSAFASRAAAARLQSTPVADAPSGPPRAEPEPQARVEPKRRRGAAIVALVAAVLLALAIGCYLVTKWGTGPAGVLDSSSTPSVSAPAGYHLVLLHSANVTFAVRDSWLALDPSSPAIKQAEQRVAAANPQLASTLTDFGSAASNIKFLAVDVGNRIYASNVEIVSLGIAKSALSDPAAAQAAFRKQIPNAVVSPTTIAGTHALLVTGTINLTLPSGGQLIVHATGYVVGTSSGVFSVMFGTTDDGQDPDVQTALRTLRLTASGS